jgi:hypothetical protein
MVCRLTHAVLIVAVFVWVAATARAADNESAVGDPRTARATNVTALSVHWEHLPLREAIARLEDNGHVSVFVDRRVDPSQLIDLTADDLAPDEVLAKLATADSLGAGRIGSLLYLGPREAVAELPSLAALRRADIAHLSASDQQPWSVASALSWPRRTEPRALVVGLLQERGLNVRGEERIPYDLWAADNLPRLALGDQLTVLLLGFDLTFRPIAGKADVEIIPIDDPLPSVAETKQSKAKQAEQRPLAPHQKGPSKQVFTLRVAEQPVGKVVEKIAQQLHLELVVDQVAIQAAGQSLDERVSFEVKNADLNGLLDAVFQSTGLTYERSDTRLTIKPK